MASAFVHSAVSLNFEAAAATVRASLRGRHALLNAPLLLSHSDVAKIANGMNDKVAMMIMNVTRALGGLVIGFIYSWKISLVILACAPVIAMLSGILFKVTLTTTAAGVVCACAFSELLSRVFHGSQQPFS